MPVADWIERYDGSRIDPQIKRRIIDMLAEPRSQISYRDIENCTGVTYNAIKGIEHTAGQALQERKAILLAKSMRVADRAIERLEDQVETAPLNMLVPIYGVTCDKIRDMTAAEQPTARIQVDISIQDIYSDFRSVQDRIADSIQALPSANPVKAIQDADQA